MNGKTKTIDQVFTIEDSRKIADLAVQLGRNVEIIKTSGHPDNDWESLLEQIGDYQVAFMPVIVKAVIDLKNHSKETYGLEKYLPSLAH